jgi:hypothetical protein
MNFGKPQGECYRPFRPLEFLFWLAGYSILELKGSDFQCFTLYARLWVPAENQRFIRAHYDNPLQERVRL